MANEQTSKSNSIFGKTLDVIGTILIILAIVICLVLMVPKLFGIQSYTVLTGSMEPSIPVGSLVMAKSVDPLTLQADDVAVFYDGMSTVPVTHRVIENRTGDGMIVTKGDANGQADIAPIPYYNIVGKMILHIPFLGRLLIPLGSLTGKLGMLAFIAAGFLLTVLGRRI